MSDNDPEIVTLLREIRDLQKAHFERYKEFTATALDRQKESTAALERSRADTENFRAQVKEQQLETRRLITRSRLISILTLAVVTVAVGGLILLSMLRSQLP